MSGYIAKGTPLENIPWKGDYVNGSGDVYPDDGNNISDGHHIIFRDRNCQQVATAGDRVSGVVTSSNDKGIVWINITGRKNAMGEQLLQAVIANWQVAWASNEQFPHYQALVIDGIEPKIVDIDGKVAESRGCPKQMLGVSDKVYDKVWRRYTQDHYSPTTEGLANFIMTASPIVKSRLTSVKALRPQILAAKNGLSCFGDEVVLLTVGNQAQMMMLTVFEGATKTGAYAYGKFDEVGSDWVYFSRDHPAVRRALSLTELEVEVPSAENYPAIAKVIAKEVKPWQDQCWGGLCVTSHRGWWEETTLPGGLKPRLKTGITEPEPSGDFLYFPIGYGYVNVTAPKNGNLFVMPAGESVANENWKIEQHGEEWMVIAPCNGVSTKVPITMGWNDADGKQQLWTGDFLIAPYGYMIPRSEQVKIPVPVK